MTVLDAFVGANELGILRLGALREVILLKAKHCRHNTSAGTPAREIAVAMPAEHALPHKAGEERTEPVVSSRESTLLYIDIIFGAVLTCYFRL
jgi:hypothetical protein